MAKNIRRMLAMFMVLSMFAGAMPLQALAADGTVHTTEISPEGLTTDVATTTTTTPKADGTTEITVTVEKTTDDTTAAGVEVKREETTTTTTVTDGDGDVVSELTVNEGKENTKGSLIPENVTVEVPGEAGKSNSVEVGVPGSVVTGDIKQGENDPEYDQTTTTVIESGSVTVTNNGTTVTDKSDATKNEYTYMNNETEATKDNDLVNAGGALEDVTIEEGYSHAIAGNGLFSHFGSAFLFHDPTYEGEKPAFYDKDGTPYYLGAAPSAFESGGFYVDNYFHEGTVTTEKHYARWGYVQQFILMDEDGKYVTTYCADQVTSTQDGYNYVMENVEDADYYTDAQAEKIRAIAENGYWGTKSGYGSLEEVKNKMRASGQFTEAELDLLTDGVAMTATQYAIWSFSNAANGDKFVNVYGVDENGDVSRVADGEKAKVDLIYKMYNYLTGLKASATEKTTADTIINDQNAIENMAVTVVKKAEDHAANKDDNKNNDAYVTDLRFALVVEPAKDEFGNDTSDLKVTVKTADGQEYIGRISGEKQDGEYDLDRDDDGNYWFRGIVLTEGDQTFTLNLEGVQNLKQGVYLYTSEVRTDNKGNQVGSQTMVGVASGKRDVNVSMDISFSLDVEEGVVATERVWRNEYDPKNPPEDPNNPPEGPQDPPETPWNRPRNQRLANDGVEIPEEPVPLAAPVITGDNTALWVAFALMVAFCMVMVNLTDKKRNHETF